MYIFKQYFEGLHNRSLMIVCELNNNLLLNTQNTFKFVCA
jgi:hypothetical protein